MDGDLPFLGAPLVPGHEIVGEVVAQGDGVSVPLGTRLGVPWLGYTDGQCEFCLRGEENLCDHARFTGYHLDGGYAEHVVADARYCFELPPSIDDTHAAPLLCAGLIGYRSWRFARDAHRLGIYGFGAAAHIVAQVARWHGQEIYAFTRPGDVHAQQFAAELGASVDRRQRSTPAGAARRCNHLRTRRRPGAVRRCARLRKGGTLVCGGIHMSDIPAMPYSLLWGERSIRSVANLTRRDGVEFLALAGRIPIETHIETFALADANDALGRLRKGALTGAAVLLP